MARSRPAAAAFRSLTAASDGDLTAEDAIEYGDLDKKYQESTFAAHFVEVAVDSATGQIRVRRMLAVCASGRILNPKTARSQVIGAMTMGVGAALMEHSWSTSGSASSSIMISPAMRFRSTPTFPIRTSSSSMKRTRSPRP